MELFFAKLAVAAIPMILLVTTIIILDRRTRKSLVILYRGNRRRHTVRSAFATAAFLRWF